MHLDFVLAVGSMLGLAAALPADERHPRRAPASMSFVLPPPLFTLPSLSIDHPKPIISLSPSSHDVAPTEPAFPDAQAEGEGEGQASKSHKSKPHLSMSAYGMSMSMSMSLPPPPISQGSSFVLPPTTPGSAPTFSTSLSLPMSSSSGISGSSFVLPPSMPGSAPTFSTSLALPSSASSGSPGSSFNLPIPTLSSSVISDGSSSTSVSVGFPTPSGSSSSMSFNLPMPTPSSSPVSSAIASFPSLGGPGPVQISTSLLPSSGAINGPSSGMPAMPTAMRGHEMRAGDMHDVNDERELDMKMMNVGMEEGTEKDREREGNIGLQWDTEPKEKLHADQDMKDSTEKKTKKPKSMPAYTTPSAPTSSNCMAAYSGPRDSVSISSWSAAHCRSTSMMMQAQGTKRVD